MGRVQIREVTITSERPGAAAAFYRDVLELPVASDGVRATVTIGSSRLVVKQGEEYAGVHHLAIGIAPADFVLAKAWSGQRVELISVTTPP